MWPAGAVPLCVCVPVGLQTEDPSGVMVMRVMQVERGPVQPPR